MTGKYPMRQGIVDFKQIKNSIFLLTTLRIGMQGPSISAAERRSLPPGKIFPQYFKVLVLRNTYIYTYL